VNETCIVLDYDFYGYLIMKHYFAKFIFIVGLVVSGCNVGSTSTSSNSPAPADSIIRPDGVNLGGLFVLEDWFFSSPDLGQLVSTPCGSVIGSSELFANGYAPSGHAVPKFNWSSETDFVYKLRNTYQFTDEQVIDLFQHHRDSYFNKNGLDSLNANFKSLQQMGVKSVRLPITWAITYPDHAYTIYGTTGSVTVPQVTDNRSRLIQDPFYKDLKWVSIPVQQLEQVLQIAAQNNIKVLIDIHAYPGGSSEGTFNGVWPKHPLFWTAMQSIDGKPAYQQNFQTIFGSLVNWADKLVTDSKKADIAAGLGGLTPMNEPAHLFGIHAGCSASESWGITSYTQVLDTLQLAIDQFGKSALPNKDPKKNVKLYMNVIETMYNGHGNVMQDFGNWWKGIATADQRQKWAVLDMHHYVAWDSAHQCNTCLNDALATDLKTHETIITKAGFERIDKCSAWFKDLRTELGLNDGSLISSSEFSASTHFDTHQSCSSGVIPSLKIANSAEYRNYFVQQQLRYAQQGNVETYFWTWMIPYNTNFQNEWSWFSICNSAGQSSDFCRKWKK